jgi:hypothetical protein
LQSSTFFSCGTLDFGIAGPSDEAELDRRICGLEGSDSQPTGLCDYTLTQLDDSCSILPDGRPCGTQVRPRHWPGQIQTPMPTVNPILIHTSASQQPLESSKPLITLGIVGFLGTQCSSTRNTVHQTSPSGFRFLVRLLPGSCLWAWTTSAQPGQTVLWLKWHGRPVEKVLPSMFAV